jgi:thiol-disulfide isomerase/thioredoxin
MTYVPRVLAVLTFSALLQACGGAGEEAAAPAATPATQAESPTPEGAARATEAAYQDLAGNPVDIADFAGKKVFVNYWATWCAPCIKEIPSINRAAAALAPEGVVFLLASDEKLETINDFLLDRGFEGAFVKLNTYVGAIGINVMPTSVLYDETGQLVRTWEGAFEWDSEEMLAQIRNPG